MYMFPYGVWVTPEPYPQPTQVTFWLMDSLTIYPSLAVDKCSLSSGTNAYLSLRSECLGSSTPPILLEVKVSHICSSSPTPSMTSWVTLHSWAQFFYLSASLKGPYLTVSYPIPCLSLIFYLPYYSGTSAPLLQNFTNHPGPMSTPVHPQSTLGIWSFSLLWTNVPHPFTLITLIGRVLQGNSCNSHSY